MMELFKDLCNLSNVSYHEGFKPFIGRLIRSKYACSSMKTNVSYVWPLVRPGAPQQLRDLKKAVDSYATIFRKETVRALPCSGTLMFKVMKNLAHDDEYMACFLGLTCGLRPSDTQWLRRNCFTWDVDGRDQEGGHYNFYLTFSKNRRGLEDRKSSPDIPFGWSVRPTIRALRILKKAKKNPENFILKDYKYSRLYYGLKTAQKRTPGAKGLKLLPMDYRRFYINQVTESVEHSQWARYTLHKNPDQIEAHYWLVRMGNEGDIRPSEGGNRDERPTQRRRFESPTARR